jgi:ApaG protein
MNIHISTITHYLASESNPAESDYLFSYTITIQNQGQALAQLISRHWIITDGNNHVEEIKGLGVIGYQPVLEAGQQFEYTSGCHLSTPFGTMEGRYQFVTETGEPFWITIPLFMLKSDTALH